MHRCTETKKPKGKKRSGKHGDRIEVKWNLNKSAVVDVSTTNNNHKLKEGEERDENECPPKKSFLVAMTPSQKTDNDNNKQKKAGGCYPSFSDESLRGKTETKEQLQRTRTRKNATIKARRR
jgi:hypothetical protein